MRIFMMLALLIFIGIQAPAKTIPLHKLSRVEQAERIAGDLKMVVVYRAGLSNATAFAALQTNLFPAATSDKSRLPRREEKEIFWQAWKSHLDYLLALDALDAGQDDWLLLSGERRGKSFAVGYAAFLAKYRFSLEFVALA